MANSSSEVPNDLIEASQAAIMIGFYLVKRLKDGADFDDLKDFMDKMVNDEEFSGMIQKAAAGSSDIPREIEGMSLKGWGGVAKASFNQIVTELGRW